MTAADKAARALLDGRIRVVKLTDRGIALKCKSAKGCTSYIASVYRDEIGVVRSCTCPNGRVHPIHPRCWHVAAADLLTNLTASERTHHDRDR